MPDKTTKQSIIELQRAVGANIRRYRLKRGITQKELAELTGIMADYISRLERGKCNAHLSRVEAIADALGVPGVALFERQEAGESRPTL